MGPGHETTDPHKNLSTKLFFFFLGVCCSLQILFFGIEQEKNTSDPRELNKSKDLQHNGVKNFSHETYELTATQSTKRFLLCELKHPTSSNYPPERGEIEPCYESKKLMNRLRTTNSAEI